MATMKQKLDNLDRRVGEVIDTYPSKAEPIPVSDSEVFLGQWSGTIAVASEYMDEEIRESLHSSFPLDGTDQQFVDAYAKLHQEKFNEVFVIN